MRFRNFSILVSFKSVHLQLSVRTRAGSGAAPAAACMRRSAGARSASGAAARATETIANAMSDVTDRFDKSALANWNWNPRKSANGEQVTHDPIANNPSLTLVNSGGEDNPLVMKQGRATFFRNYVKRAIWNK